MDRHTGSNVCWTLLYGSQSDEVRRLQLCDCSLKLGLTGTFEISIRGLTIAAKCLICIKLIVTLSETRANINKLQYIPIPQGQDLILAGHLPPLWSDLHSISAALKHERNYLEPVFKDTLILPYCFAWITREGASFFFFFWWVLISRWCDLWSRALKPWVVLLTGTVLSNKQLL